MNLFCMLTLWNFENMGKSREENKNHLQFYLSERIIIHLLGYSPRLYCFK